MSLAYLGLHYPLGTAKLGWNLKVLYGFCGDVIRWCWGGTGMQRTGCVNHDPPATDLKFIIHQPITSLMIRATRARLRAAQSLSERVSMT